MWNYKYKTLTKEQIEHNRLIEQKRIDEQNKELNNTYDKLISNMNKNRKRYKINLGV